MDKLETFINRMKRLNIDVKLVGNFPWIYVDSINGKRVMEKYLGNHGFTVAFTPILKEQELEFTDIGKIFCLIRKYCNMENKHELENTLENLKTFKQNLDNFVAPPNSGGWSLSNLPAHFWETIGECIDDVEKYIENHKV